VVLVIFLFLHRLVATLIPALTIRSLIGAVARLPSATARTTCRCSASAGRRVGGGRRDRGARKHHALR
jgi:hypothetical protein